MRILLTGASGFTGRHFQAHATQAGHEVMALHANLTEPASLQQGVQAAGPVDAVVHLAAISFVGHANDAEFYAVNTVGTTHLLAALAALPASDRPKKVLVASSANVYGNCPHSPIAETQPPAPINHYGASKLAMEHMAKTFLDKLPVVITRAFNYTGPGQTTAFLIPKLIEHFQRLAPVVELGNTQVEREFNDVQMTADVYLKLLGHGIPSELYNVCSGRAYSLNSIIQLLIEMTGHTIEVKVNPKFIRENEVHRLCGDPNKLHQCIGYIPNYELQDCLKRMLETSTTQKTRT
ncbi:MAG: GDP-mannose 4,6-dehydratase [Pseudomonadota bacterium]